MTHEPFPTDRPAVVTCGLPYANGDLHIGHLRTYVSGDVMARALRRLGQQTAFACGSDMHGTPIAVNAEEAGVSPEDFALEWHETYAETFPEFDVEFDNYGHTDDETNRELTREFVETWIDQDHVYEQPLEVAWDPVVDQPLPDRYVEGTCPYCGEQARGDECDEGCQRHLEPGDLEEPTSVLTGNRAEYRTRTHKFLRLSDFQAYLADFIDRLEGTENAKHQPREWIEGELQDLCITRDMDWGIDYPADTDEDAGAQAEDLVLYVWVDAPIEYVASSKQYSERVGVEAFDWRAVWQGESTPGPEGTVDGGEIVHVIGRDIIQHHTVFWPAMLRAAGYNEPRAVMASGFVNLEGAAFSTSRNRAVWAEDYLETGFSPDLLRYYLTTTGGFQQDVDFSWSKFQDRVNGELVGTIGNFLYRSLLFAHRNYGGTPDVAVSEEVQDRIEEAIADFESAVNDYEPRHVGTAALELAGFGNEYIQRHEPWNLIEDDPGKAAAVIRDCIQLGKAVAVLVEPITPRLAAGVWDQLEEPDDVHAVTLEEALVAPPDTFGEPDELVEQIEDERVAALNEQLQERIEAATGESEGADGNDGSGDGGGSDGSDGGGGSDGSDPGAGGDSAEAADLEALSEERIAVEEFRDLDLRVARIEAAEPIEGADELLRLDVDVGVEHRQVVAGLRGLHDPEELRGTRVVLLANMEPAELFGVESNGMVLAAGANADLLTTHGESPIGTRIR